MSKYHIVGNHMSRLILFLLFSAVILVSPPPQTGTSEKTVGLAVGLTLALVLLIAVAVIAVFLYR